MNQRPTFKLLLLLTAIWISGLAACDLVVPPDRPLPETLVLPTDFVFETIDLLDYEYIGVIRIDCPMVMSELTATGRCFPNKSPKGQTVRCPLAAPFDALEVGCLTDDPVAATYVDLSWKADAKDIKLPEFMGTCRMADAGPAAAQPERYPTDPGFRVCLFEPDLNRIDGRLSSEDNTSRPIGLYADLQNATALIPENSASPTMFSGALHIMLDARYLNDEDRETAWKTLPMILNIYRDPATIRTDTKTNLEKQQLQPDPVTVDAPETVGDPGTD